MHNNEPRWKPLDSTATPDSSSPALEDKTSEETLKTLWTKKWDTKTGNAEQQQTRQKAPPTDKRRTNPRTKTRWINDSSPKPKQCAALRWFPIYRLLPGRLVLPSVRLGRSCGSGFLLFRSVFITTHLCGWPHFHVSGGSGAPLGRSEARMALVKSDTKICWWLFPKI